MMKWYAIKGIIEASDVSDDGYVKLRLECYSDASGAECFALPNWNDPPVLVPVDQYFSLKIALAAATPDTPISNRPRIEVEIDETSQRIRFSRFWSGPS